MKIKSYKYTPFWFRFLLVIFLLLGIFFRFTNIDKKIYWHDEAYTSLRISGYTMEQVIQNVSARNEINIKELQQYQRIRPDSQLIETIKSLAIEDPQHPPLYYVLLRFWAQWFGDSVVVIRSLTILISLLVFPSVYWLCIELFKSSLVGWIAVALLAVSPVHVLFAQEAREYCLSTVTILLSSAALLRAMRLNTKLNWGIYAGTLAISLYTLLLSVLVAIGHGIYVAVNEKFIASKRAIAYLLASSAAILIYLPWLLTIILSFYTFVGTTSWTSRYISKINLFENWLLNFSHIFFDIGSEPPEIFISLILLILFGSSIYILLKTTSQRVWLFILTLMGVTALSLMLPDIILGGQRSIIPRYLFPCYLGIQLTVAYLLATQISSATSRIRIGQAILTLLLVGGVISCQISS